MLAYTVESNNNLKVAIEGAGISGICSCASDSASCISGASTGSVPAGVFSLVGFLAFSRAP